MNSASVLVNFTVVNNPLESQFDITCVDKLLSTVNSVLVDSAMNANDFDEFLEIDIILIMKTKFFRDPGD